MVLSSGDADMYDGALFWFRGDFLDYLGLENMGVFTAYGAQNGSAAKLEELREFGASLVRMFVTKLKMNNTYPQKVGSEPKPLGVRLQMNRRSAV